MPDRVVVVGLGSTGQAVEIPADSTAGLAVSLGSRLAGEDLTADRMLVEEGCQPTRITGGTAAVSIKSTAGYLARIIIAKPVDTKTITITADGATIGVITCSGAIPFTVPCGFRFASSLSITPSDASIDAIVVWR